MNNVQLIGRLTKEVEVRKTQSGASYARFSLAVPRKFEKNATDFINCVAWRKTADNLGLYTSKGDRIGVTGFIQTGSYDDRDGKRVYTFDVVLNDFDLLEPKKQEHNPPVEEHEPEDPGESFTVGPDDLPF